jgi:hypothetical protein
MNCRLKRGGEASRRDAATPVASGTIALQFKERRDTFQASSPTKGNWLGRETHPLRCAVGRPAHNRGEGEQAGRLFNSAMENTGGSLLREAATKARLPAPLLRTKRTWKYAFLRNEPPSYPAYLEWFMRFEVYRWADLVAEYDDDHERRCSRRVVGLTFPPLHR